MRSGLRLLAPPAELAAAPSEDGAVDIAAIYRAHAPKVARWATRLAGPSVDLEDVVQEVFLVAKRRLRTFDGRAKITTWLFRTTEKVVLTSRRKQRLRRWLAFGSRGDETPGMGAAAPAPGEALERSEEIAGVYRVLDRLPERLRRILILFELEGMSTQEIADLTGERPGTVRVRLFRARAKFLEEHQALAESGFERRGEP